MRLEWLVNLNKVVNNFIWGPVMLLFLVGTGVYFTVRTNFFQVGKFALTMKHTLGAIIGGKTKAKSDEISPFRALTVAMASTVGVGNVAGVATAIVAGGPGAVFWMWVSAFFGMMTKYAEVVLAVYYRKTDNHGEHYGGPMYYIQEGIGWKWLATIFALLGGLASFGIGNLAQSNTIASSLNSSFGIPPLYTGIAVAIIVGLVIFGGIKRIGLVTETIVPFMAVFYILGGIVTLILNANAIPAALGEIFSGAFSMKSVGGGIMGYAFMSAMRYGIARGVFSNEAGLGSAPIAHASAHTNEPVEQGLWGIFEVFVDTILICTITGLVVVTSGLAGTGPEGASLTSAAFSNTLGVWGGRFVSIAVLFFAFSTILGWAYYGEKCFGFVSGNSKAVLALVRIVWLPMIVVSAVGKVDIVWDISDTLNGLMMIPNLIALLLLSGTVVKLTKKYLKEKSGLHS